jgi:hypothetical protein
LDNCHLAATQITGVLLAEKEVNASPFAVWLVALLSGFVLYLSFYWTLLFG